MEERQLGFTALIEERHQLGSLPYTEERQLGFIARAEDRKRAV